jgi:DNA-binding NarL/FixJ family response regulator
MTSGLSRHVAQAGDPMTLFAGRASSYRKELGGGSPTSIALVDDHPVVLQGLEMVFGTNPQYRVVAKGQSADDAQAIADAEAPDVMLMDLSMPGDIFSTISSISRSEKCIRVIVFTASTTASLTLKALDAGASGFVLKGAPCAELLEAVGSVTNGEVFISRQHASTVLLSLRSKKPDEAAGDAIRLTVREKQISDQLLLAATNREIARNLSISEKTVKRYMTTLMQKLKARNRVEVAILTQKYSAKPDR